MNEDMEAECSDDVMKLRVKFNATFNGLVYSAGKSDHKISTINIHPECIHNISIIVTAKC